MNNLPKWILTNPFPAFHDVESGTAIEQTAKVYGAMQSLIDEYNAFVESTEAKINEFTADTEADQKVFETSLRQEFQDFIDTVTLKLVGYDGSLSDFEELISRKTIETFNTAVANGDIEVKAVYNNTTESLDYILSATEV